MLKLATLCVAVLGAGLLVLGTAPGASAYPDTGCDLSVNRQELNPGDTFVARGTVTGADPSASVTWTFRWNGTTKVRSGAVAQAAFTAPRVKKTRHIRLTGTAKSSLGTCTRHIDITVAGTQVSAPGGSSGSGGMPNTGGPAFRILLAALALLAAGGATVLAGRRRHR